MGKTINCLVLTLMLSLVVCQADAQLSSNPDKFLGNITTVGQMDYNGFLFSDYWNQATPENETKWQSVEGSRGTYNWWGADNVYNYVKGKKMPFKFHCLIWGSQYPVWLKNLSPAERYKAIEKWMDAVKNHYPNLDMIDVVNEAVEGHQSDTYLMQEALGGKGETGYDWIVKAFEMAHERWPDAILIYNDFNTFRHNVDQYIDLVRTLRDAGAPIDAYGCQSHDLGGMNQTDFRNVMTRLQNALKMPMYITEYDIADTNDANQKWNYQQHFPVMWEADYCAGVTLWGWHYGKTWLHDENSDEKGISGIIKGKVERSAMEWLREYMQTDKAKTAKSPFPGMKKEASVYVRPSSLRGMLGEPMPIDVRASMRTKTIESVELYVNNVLVGTMTEAPYTFDYMPQDNGHYDVKAVVTASDGSKYERLSRFRITSPLVLDKRYSGLSGLVGKTFAIINEAEEKALYGSTDQNLKYDEYDKAFDEKNTGYMFKLLNSSVVGKYLLRLITPQNTEYSIWNSPGYLNGYSTQSDCSFILGLNNQNGEDVKNGAVWEIKYVEGKGYTLRNQYTGKYLHDASSAKYDEPAYFTFGTLGYQTTGIDERVRMNDETDSTTVYNLMGQPVNEKDMTSGVYIRKGKKFVVR